MSPYAYMIMFSLIIIPLRWERIDVLLLFVDEKIVGQSNKSRRKNGLDSHVIIQSSILWSPISLQQLNHLMSCDMVSGDHKDSKGLQCSPLPCGPRGQQHHVALLIIKDQPLFLCLLGVLDMLSLYVSIRFWLQRAYQNSFIDALTHFLSWKLVQKPV